MSARADGYYWIRLREGPSEPQVAHWSVWIRYDGQTDAEWELCGLDYGTSDEQVCVLAGPLEPPSDAVAAPSAPTDRRPPWFEPGYDDAADEPPQEPEPGP